MPRAARDAGPSEAPACEVGASVGHAGPVTIGDVLAAAAAGLRGAGVEGARQEALLLLEHALGIPRATLLAFPERPVADAGRDRYAELVGRRAAREPYAYIVGEREFYGRPFLVDARVLVPRPETELLVEAALEILRARSGVTHPPDDEGTRRSGSPPLLVPRGHAAETSSLVVDVGTGSGAIACTIAAEMPAARVVASDASADALEVAAHNRARLGLAGRVRLVRGDLLTWLGRPADLVLANLPYLPPARESDLMPEVARFEPHAALFAEQGGLLLIRRLLRDTRRAVASGGSVLLEMDPEQVDAIRRSAPWARVTVLRDLSGHERVVRLDLP